MAYESAVATLMAQLGTEATIRRWNGSSFDETTETVVITPTASGFSQSAYDRTSINQLMPVLRIVVYSEAAIDGFRDQVVWEGKTYQMVEPHPANTLITIYSCLMQEIPDA